MEFFSGHIKLLFLFGIWLGSGVMRSTWFVLFNKHREVIIIPLLFHLVFFIFEIEFQDWFFIEPHYGTIVVGISYLHWHRNKFQTSFLVSCCFSSLSHHFFRTGYPFSSSLHIIIFLFVVKKCCPVDCDLTICAFFLLFLSSLSHFSCSKGSIECFKLLLLWISVWLILGMCII